MGQPVAEPGSVRQPREHVEVRETMDLLQEVRSLGRILDRARDAGDATGGIAQRLAQHVDVAEIRSRSEYAHVEPFEHNAAGEPDQPLAKGAPVVAVDKAPQRRKPRAELLGVNLQNAVDLARADQAVGRAFPLPASNPGDALNASELPGDASTVILV